MTPTDFIQAHRDAVLIRAGALNPNAPICHPQAAAVAVSAEPLLPALAKFCSDLADSRRGASAAVRAKGSGFSTPDFGNALADAVRVVTQARMAAHMRHEIFCKPMPVVDYKPQRFPMLAIGADLEFLGESSEAPEAMVSDEAGALAGLGRYGRNVLISRPVLINDDIGLIMATFENFGTAAARVEAKLAYALIESNVVLSDGEAMFDPLQGNVLASALAESTLGTAMGMLRAMPDPFGETLDHDPAVLVVEGALELLARRLVREAGLELEVVASSRLPSGRWYLLPNPEVAPVIGVLRMAGSKSPVSIDAGRDDLGRDGTLIAVRANAAVVPLNRIAIKGGA
ncbi:MAG: hypothetical protein Q8N48_00180 [Thiobacillus sp.]|nr:hypothetical protein [Thiobacillus sp.]MDP2977228.1 hypothetical protein [Thiobacillus sp.]